jgi:integrase
VKGNAPENKVLEMLRSDAYNIYYDFEVKKKRLTPELFKKWFLGEELADVTWKGLSETYQSKSNNAEGTKRSYKARHRSFMNFLEDLGQGETLAQLIDGTHFAKFYEFNRGLGFTDIYAGKILQYVKRVVNYGLSIGLIAKTPLVNVKITIKPNIQQSYLADEDLMKLKKAIIPDDLTPIRDAFLFCCYTGLEISAIKTFDAFNDLKQIKGIDVVFKARKKTCAERIVPLTPDAIAILERRNSTFVLPSMQKMRLKLKVIMGFAGIKRRVVWHDSRKTFAYLCLNHFGYSLDATAALMGHASTKELKPYASIKFERIYSEFIKNNEEHKKRQIN